MESMGLMLIIVRVFGSLTMEMSGVQSVQFMRGVGGVMCLMAWIGLGLWVLVGFVVGLGTGGCCGRIG
jgi:hypothetical protein